MNNATVLKRASINPTEGLSYATIEPYSNHSNLNVLKDNYNDANEYQLPLRCFETLAGSKHTFISKRVK